MSRTMEFDYYYGIEAEQFSFYRVPRLLIKDERFKGLSSDAKILYGLMLDRMSLSMKNGWLDEGNRAYIIYAVENIMEDLGCSKPTCIKIMRELDSDNGIGLIEKKRRGLGKPDLIYVKNFASLTGKETEGGTEKRSENTDSFAEVKNLYFKKEKNLTSARKETELQEVKKADFKREKFLTSRGKEIELQEVKNPAPNYNKPNYTDKKQNNPIHLSERERKAGKEESQQVYTIMPKNNMDTMDEMESANAYMALIRKNLEYEHYMAYAPHGDRELFEEIYETI